MISKNKKTTTGSIQEVMDKSVRPDFPKSHLPAAYRRLLRLIFFSTNPLIHKVPFHD
jgi:hypothetical protein